MFPNIQIVKMVITSLVNSRPDGITSIELKKEYRSVENSGIPYRNFGYRTLDSFIAEELEANVRIEEDMNSTLFYPIATAKSEHIIEFKRNEKRKKRSYRPVRSVLPPRVKTQLNKNLMSEVRPQFGQYILFKCFPGSYCILFHSSGQTGFAQSHPEPIQTIDGTKNQYFTKGHNFNSDCFIHHKNQNIRSTKTKFC